MAKPKFDYNSDAFYNEIFALAFQGMNDAEIADNLSSGLGQTLSPEVFSRMKNGCYDKWTEEQNKERSERIGQVLAHARRKINSIVRGAFLKAALGGKKIKNVSRVYAQYKCDCGSDMSCVLCGGTGTITSERKAVIKEDEIELAPSQQALATWLYHHDEEWRRIQRKEDSENEIPTDIQKGVDINAWINDQIKE